MKQEAVTVSDTKKGDLTTMSSKIRYLAAQWLEDFISKQRQRTFKISRQDVEARSINSISDVLFTDIDSKELGISQFFGVHLKHCLIFRNFSC